LRVWAPSFHFFYRPLDGNPAELDGPATAFCQALEVVRILSVGDRTVNITLHNKSPNAVCIVAFDSQYHSDDGTAIASAREALTGDAITAAQSRVVVDLTETEYFGSEFVGLLFALGRRVKELGGRLAACGVNEHCKEVLEVTRFAKICPIFESRSEAVTSVAG
jgi:anti-anti-sigma factor